MYLYCICLSVVRIFESVPNYILVSRLVGDIRPPTTKL